MWTPEIVTGPLLISTTRFQPDPSMRSDAAPGPSIASGRSITSSPSPAPDCSVIVAGSGRSNVMTSPPLADALAIASRSVHDSGVQPMPTASVVELTTSSLAPAGATTIESNNKVRAFMIRSGQDRRETVANRHRTRYVLSAYWRCLVLFVEAIDSSFPVIMRDLARSLLDFARYAEPP